MAENIEKDAANTMASSQSAGKNKVLDVIATRFFYGNGRNSDSSGSGGSGGGGKGTTGNGWTAEDYKNHNEYKDNEHERQTKTDANREVLINASRNARHIRDKDTMEHAKTFGQVRNIDLSTNTKRKVINFGATPARQTNAGKGTGAQGTSKQQTSGKGAAAGRVVGAVLGGAVTENPRGATAGGALGAKVGDAIEKKVINRTPKAKLTSADLTTTTVKPNAKKA